MNEKPNKFLGQIHDYITKMTMGQIMSVFALFVSAIVLCSSIQAVIQKGENKIMRFGVGIFTSSFTLYSAYLLNKNKDEFNI